MANCSMWCLLVKRLGESWDGLTAEGLKLPFERRPHPLPSTADDPLFGNGGFGLIESWRAAHRPVEFHLYEQGGHGFGMYRKETTSTGWFEAFARWMGMPAICIACIRR